MARASDSLFFLFSSLDFWRKKMIKFDFEREKLNGLVLRIESL